MDIERGRRRLGPDTKTKVVARGWGPENYCKRGKEATGIGTGKGRGRRISGSMPAKQVPRYVMWRRVVTV